MIVPMALAVSRHIHHPVVIGELHTGSWDQRRLRVTRRTVHKSAWVMPSGSMAFKVLHGRRLTSFLALNLVVPVAAQTHSRIRSPWKPPIRYEVSGAQKPWKHRSDQACPYIIASPQVSMGDNKMG